ncbi:unnamed protein product [Symbiodinium pilosum]|uniref:Uncharacterized protein n=1 Tax=Symbiodinium pilosum TaxID=2952 RepID=A0A812VR56_SYMPI|nr:unnamed protein product [Symbiodinium pilosum]
MAEPQDEIKVKTENEQLPQMISQPSVHGRAPPDVTEGPEAPNAKAQLGVDSYDDEVEAAQQEFSVEEFPEASREGQQDPSRLSRLDQGAQMPSLDLQMPPTPMAEGTDAYQVGVVAELCGELEEAQRQHAEAQQALVEEEKVAGAAAQTMSELRAQLEEAVQAKDQLQTEFGTEQLLRKRAAAELQLKKALASPDAGQVVKLQRELSKSEHALRGMQRRHLHEKDAQRSQSSAESRLLRTEYKAELAAAKRYQRAAARPPPPAERSPLERAEAAAARGMRRLEMQGEATASISPPQILRTLRR